METLDRIDVSSTPAITEDQTVDHAPATPAGIGEGEVAREARRRTAKGWIVYAVIIVASAVAAAAASPR